MHTAEAYMPQPGIMLFQLSDIECTIKELYWEEWKRKSKAKPMIVTFKELSFLVIKKFSMH